MNSLSVAKGQTEVSQWIASTECVCVLLGTTHLRKICEQFECGGGSLDAVPSHVQIQIAHRAACTLQQRSS